MGILSLGFRVIVGYMGVQGLGSYRDIWVYVPPNGSND